LSIFGQGAKTLDWHHLGGDTESSRDLGYAFAIGPSVLVLAIESAWNDSDQVHATRALFVHFPKISGKNGVARDPKDTVVENRCGEIQPLHLRQIAQLFNRQLYGSDFRAPLFSTRQ
jgi:hypothetical protein